jgi:predicted DNA binding CopG/RHH family protein
MKQGLPRLKTDAEAEAFVADADLTDYDLSGMVQARFEMKPKDRPANPHLPDEQD